MTDKNKEKLADIMTEMRNRADTVIEGRTITERNFVPQGVVEDWAGRIEAAVLRERSKWERERRAYEKLHDCFWEENAIQSIVRQMLDARDDLRRVDPREADDLEYYAHGLMRAAKSAPAPGNAAAMRETLCDIAAQCLYVAEGISDESDYGRVTLMRIRDKARAALAAPAAPARNCDVGTAEEQAERFREFCSKHYLCYDKDGGNACPLKGKYKTTFACELAWAQMPYGKEESNG